MIVSKDAEVVREIATVIGQRGWWDGHNNRFANGGNKECVMTAFNAVTRNRVYGTGLVIVRLQKTLGVAGIALWNDAQANGQVVIERLLEIADKWEAEDSWAVTAVEE